MTLSLESRGLVATVAVWPCYVNRSVCSGVGLSVYGANPEIKLAARITLHVMAAEAILDLVYMAMITWSTPHTPSDVTAGGIVAIC